MLNVRALALSILVFAGFIASCASDEDRSEHEASHDKNAGAGMTRHVTRTKPKYGTTRLPDVPSDGSALSWPSLAQPLLPTRGTASRYDDGALRDALIALS